MTDTVSAGNAFAENKTGLAMSLKTSSSPVPAVFVVGNNSADQALFRIVKLSQQ